VPKDGPPPPLAQVRAITPGVCKTVDVRLPWFEPRTCHVKPQVSPGMGPGLTHMWRAVRNTAPFTLWAEAGAGQRVTQPGQGRMTGHSRRIRGGEVQALRHQTGRGTVQGSLEGWQPDGLEPLSVQQGSGQPPPTQVQTASLLTVTNSTDTTQCTPSRTPITSGDVTTSGVPVAARIIPSSGALMTRTNSAPARSMRAIRLTRVRSGKI
jgi:hypothetical protein